MLTTLLHTFYFELMKEFHNFHSDNGNKHTGLYNINYK